VADAVGYRDWPHLTLIRNVHGTDLPESLTATECTQVGSINSSCRESGLWSRERRFEYCRGTYPDQARSPLNSANCLAAIPGACSRMPGEATLCPASGIVQVISNPGTARRAAGPTRSPRSADPA
jgi:hypothetical protein